MDHLKKSLFLLALFLLILSCSTENNYEWESGTWVDLTHSFSEETLYWPTSDNFKIDTVFVGITDNDFYYESYNIFTAEHGGTHLDAPIHFFENRKTVDEIDIDRLTGRAVVVDVSQKVALDRDYQIAVEDLTEWEERYGAIPDNSILLFNTGMAANWPDPELYLGTSLRGKEGVANLSFPGIHPDTARWLVENRKINAVGLDSPSLDYGKSTLFEAHQVLSEQNIPGFENVANLDQLPPVGSFVIALPMKIKNGSGAPLRIVAHIPEK